MTATSDRSALDAAMALVAQKIERRVLAKLNYEHGQDMRTHGNLALATVDLENAISLYNQELLRCVQHGGLVP